MNSLLLLGIVGYFSGLCVADIGDPITIGAPEQVHISFGGKFHRQIETRLLTYFIWMSTVSIDQMWVTWLTFENETEYGHQPTVQYGLDSAKLDMSAHGSAAFFWNGNRIAFVHRVLLSKLLANTTYRNPLLSIRFFSFTIFHRRRLSLRHQRVWLDEAV